MVNDEKTRCTWPSQNPMYRAYHDEEWGVPEYDDARLYAKLVLDGFQAGLSWITILRKREAFRDAFDGLDPNLVADYDEAKIQQLLANAGIVRHRGKIEAAISNARIWREMMATETGGFSGWLWGFVDGAPTVNHHQTSSEIPAFTETSTRLSKSLKKRGFRFVGPTIVYAFMQAVGMVNDHLVSCFRHAEVRELAQ